MGEDMYALIDKINSMIKNNEIPEDIKNIMGQISNSSNQDSERNDNKDMSSDNTEFDIATIMKMKKIMDSFKETSNDPRANLLRSLKPYLKDSRKEKVDQYIQIFSMGKIFENFNSLGGDAHK